VFTVHILPTSCAHCIFLTFSNTHYALTRSEWNKCKRDGLITYCPEVRTQWDFRSTCIGSLFKQLSTADQLCKVLVRTKTQKAVEEVSKGIVASNIDILWTVLCPGKSDERVHAGKGQHIMVPPGCRATSNIGVTYFNVGEDDVEERVSISSGFFNLPSSWSVANRTEMEAKIVMSNQSLDKWVDRTDANRMLAELDSASRDVRVSESLTPFSIWSLAAPIVTLLALVAAVAVTYKCLKLRNDRMKARLRDVEAGGRERSDLLAADDAEMRAWLTDMEERLTNAIRDGGRENRNRQAGGGSLEERLANAFSQGARENRSRQAGGNRHGRRSNTQQEEATQAAPSE
jgi:hypothetical protein